MNIGKNFLFCTILSLLLTLAACNEQPAQNPAAKPASREASQNKQHASDTSIQLQVLAATDTLHGCGEYLSLDTTPFETGRLVFVSNLGSRAFIRINNEVVILAKDSAASWVQPSNRYRSVYKAKGIQVILDLQQTKAYDEGGFYRGTLQVIKGRGSRRFAVHGESGC